MSESTREFITWILGTIVSLSVILGLVVRFILLPYLREHLVKPMKQVEKQVSENHHSNMKPTVLDRIDDVQTAIKNSREEMQTEVKALRDDMKAMAGMYEGHITWSDKWVSLVEREIDHLKSIINHKPED